MPINNESGQKIKLKLLGEWGDKDEYGKLLSVKGFESISQPFCYDLKLTTVNKQIMQKILCNKSISFVIEHYLNDELKNKRNFNGIILAVNFTKLLHVKDMPEAEIIYNLKVGPKFSNLNAAKHSKVFYKEKQTVVDIIEEILKKNKIVYELNIQSKKLFAAETYIQYNESDLNFITRIMQYAGIFYFFKHEENKHNMIVSNQTNSYFDLENKKVEYFHEYSYVGIHDIAFYYNSYIANFNTKGFSYVKPDQLVEKEYTNAIHKNQIKSDIESEEISYIGEIKDTNQVRQNAENFGIREQGESEKIVGESNYIEFAVGGKFQLQGEYFNNIDNKDCVIINLNFTVTDYLNQEQQCINNFTAMPNDRYLIPNQFAPKPVISGIHYAIVVNSEGKITSETPYCDDKGCVFIKLLWGKDVNICKANILSASNGFTLPRIGALAYVLFPNNNLGNDNPVIVGIHNEGLLNFKDKEEWYKNIYMTYPESSDKDIYNYIEFKDKKEEQEINVLAKKDINFDIKHDETITIQNNSIKSLKEGDLSITTEKGKICIKSQGPIEIETKGDLHLKADGKIIMESKGGVDIKSMGNISLDSKQNINNKAALAANYEAGTTLAVKANVQVNLEGTITDIKGKANIKISSPLTKIGM